MFKPIIHNTNDPDIQRYNLLITQKPKSNGRTLEQVIKEQRIWKNQCEKLLEKFDIRIQAG